MKTVPCSDDDFATLYEEWNARYRKVNKALEQGAEDDDALHRLVAASVAVRAGRLESIQCALFDKENQHANNDGASVEALLDFTRLEMDQQAASKEHLEVMDRLAAHSRLGTLSDSSSSPNHLQDENGNKHIEVDVDAFFSEYPECSRSDGEMSSDDDDSDNDSVKDVDKEGPPGTGLPQAKTQRRTQGSDSQAANSANPGGHSVVTPVSVSNSNPSHSYDSRPPGASQANRICNPYAHPPTKDSFTRLDPDKPHAAVGNGHGIQGNPYRKAGDEPKAFSYTPPLQRPSSSSSASSSQQQQQQQQQANDHASSRIQQQTSSWNTHHTNQSQIGGTNSAYTKDGNYRYSSHPKRLPPPPPPNTYVSNRSSWEDHQNQQNPFQTAREFAQTGGGGGSPDTTVDSQQQQRHVPHPPPSRPPMGTAENPYARGGDRQSRVPDYYANSTTNANTNSIQNPYSTGRSSHQEDSTPLTGGGPKIPESLKRKFQKPTRVGKTAGESSGTAKEAPPSRPFAPNKGGSGGVTARPQSDSNNKDDQDDDLPEELQHLDKELVKKIENEILESGETITFDEIAGLEDAKQTVYESVCWPMQRPDIYVGLRKAPTGVLLYGPPGTGKTLIGKAIAHESKATFFSISSSSLTSKWIGEGEKLVRTLFAVARYRKPAVIFIDEIDSLLTQRSSTENEASRRIKTEFLVQIDGAGTGGASDTSKEGHVLTIGATNRPQELDEAARRRFTKRMYIPLPTESDRAALFHVLLGKNQHCLVDEDFAKLAKETEGFSGADLKALCNDAALWPVRQLGSKALEVNVKDIPPISFKHCRRSLKGMKPSVSPADLVQYDEWDRIYGTSRAPKDMDEDEDSDDDVSKDSKT